jgi:hypothetical protein
MNLLAGRFRAADSPEEQAIARFGTTEDWRDAGWMLPDGTLLDFHRGGANWVRHEEVGTPVHLLLNRGWVRVAEGDRPELRIEIGRPLTSAQQNLLRAGAQTYGTFGIQLDVPAAGRRGFSYFETEAPNRIEVGRVLREANAAATVTGRLRRRRRLRRSRRA